MLWNNWCMLAKIALLYTNNKNREKEKRKEKKTFQNSKRKHAKS